MNTSATALGSGPKVVMRRPTLVLSGLLSVASAMLMGSMLAIWLDFRSKAPLRESSDGSMMLRDWLPENIKIPEVATNTMMMTIAITCIMVQWAIYSSRRADSKHTTLALGVALLTEIAVINAQIAVYMQMDIGVRDSSYTTMFYAVTATMTVLMVIGLGFTLMTMFRSLASRVSDHDLVIAHGVYWYSLAVIFATMWFVVYVQK